jgi:hypothetical protein
MLGAAAELDVSASQRRRPEQALTRSGPLSGQHCQALLDASPEHVRAKLALANAIIAAKSC